MHKGGGGGSSFCAKTTLCMKKVCNCDGQGNLSFTLLNGPFPSIFN